MLAAARCDDLSRKGLSTAEAGRLLGACGEEGAL